ncbi:MAG: hypothetical protein JWP87_5568 [Labilithrix sp.]|nr:hypothetical protein [Labilithrix sp.]
MLRFGGARHRARALLFFFSLLVGLVVTRIARADEPVAVVLVVHGDDLPREKLRDAIARELHRVVVLSDTPHGPASSGGIVTVTYRRSAGELAVTWDGPKRGTVSRIIAARKSEADVVQDASLLAANLAQTEPDELVAPAAALPVPVPVPVPDLPAPAAPAPSPTPSPPAADAPDRHLAEVNVAFLYPFAMNAGKPWQAVSFDFNLLHSRIGELEGFQLGGVNLVTHTAGRGTGNVTGVQLAYAMNIAAAKVEGVQLAMLANVAGPVEGWQYAFGFNRASGDFDGIQSAWGVNSVGGRMSGLQLASINASGDVRGLQFGFVNVAKKVDGAMIGLINVADDVDGVPFGIASITKTGGVHPAAWSSSTTFANAGVRLATRHTYTMPMFNYHHAYDRDFYGAGFAIGGRIQIDEARHIDTDLGVSWLYAPERSAFGQDSYHQHLVQPKLRAMFGWRFAEHFGAFAGAGLVTQVRLERDSKEVTIRVGPDFFAGIEL